MPKVARLLVLLVTLALVPALVANAGATGTFTWGSAVTFNGGNDAGPGTGIFSGLACTAATSCVAASTSGNYNSDILVNLEASGVWASSPTLVATPSGTSVNSSTSDGVTGTACWSSTLCAVTGDLTNSNGLAPFVFTGSPTAFSSSAKVLTLPGSQSTFSAADDVQCVSTTECVVVGQYDDPTAAASGQTKALGWAYATNSSTSKVALLSAPSDASTVNPTVSYHQLGCQSSTCFAVGSYTSRDGTESALLTSISTTATLPSASIAVTLPPNASPYGAAAFSEISCPATGNCAALGFYTTTHGAAEPMVMEGTGTLWNAAQEITMPNNANVNPRTFFFGFRGISCPSSGNCTAGGQYFDQSTSWTSSATNYQAFLVNEINGVWQTATALALPSGLGTGSPIEVGPNGGVVTLSCFSAGNCVAGASYLGTDGNYYIYLDRDVNDVWQAGTMIPMPGGNYAGVGGGPYASSCFSGWHCVAIGSYLYAGSYYGFHVNGN